MWGKVKNLVNNKVGNKKIWSLDDVPMVASLKEKSLKGNVALGKR